jgi:hypothetical protein
MSQEHHQPSIIEPEQAATLLAPYLRQREAEGWIILVQHDYMAQLTRGKRNLYIEVDLLGQVSEHESDLHPTQESGQLVAIVLLLVIFLFVLVVVTILGLI